VMTPAVALGSRGKVPSGSPYHCVQRCTNIVCSLLAANYVNTSLSQQQQQ
jgi:hypothetical protein